MKSKKKINWFLVCYELIEYGKDLLLVLAAMALCWLIISLLTGCGFSIPLGERHRADIWIDGRIVPTEELPPIWLGDK